MGFGETLAVDDWFLVDFDRNESVLGDGEFFARFSVRNSPENSAKTLLISLSCSSSLHLNFSSPSLNFTPSSLFLACVCIVRVVNYASL